MRQFKGKVFKVGNEVSWKLSENFKDALEVYYIFKSYTNNVKIWDAVTGKIIFG